MRVLVCFIALLDSVEYWVNVGHVRGSAFTDLASMTGGKCIPSSDVRYHENKPAWCEWASAILSPFLEARTDAIPYAHASGQVSSTPFMLFNSPGSLKKGLDELLEKVEDSESRLLFTQIFSSIMDFSSGTFERYTHPKSEHAQQYFYDDSHEQWDRRSLSICCLGGQGLFAHHPVLGDIRDIRGPFQWDNGVRISEDGRRHRIDSGDMPGCIKFMIEIHTADDPETKVAHCFLGSSVHYNAHYKGASSFFHRFRITHPIDTLQPEVVREILAQLKEERDIDGHFHIRSTVDPKRGTQHFVIEITFPSICGRGELCRAFSSAAQALERLIPWETPDSVHCCFSCEFEFAAKEASPNYSCGKEVAMLDRRRRLGMAEKVILWSAPGRHEIPQNVTSAFEVNRKRSKSVPSRLRAKGLCNRIKAI